MSFTLTNSAVAFTLKYCYSCNTAILLLLYPGILPTFVFFSCNVESNLLYNSKLFVVNS